MFTINRITPLATYSLVMGVFLSACGQVPAINGGQILVSPDTNILINEQATLKIDVIVQGASPEFNWTAEKGKISNPNAPSVIYTAPATSGPDLVTVVVTAGKTTFTQTTIFNVIELPPPTPTDTPVPADTPTPTAVPEAVVCDVPAITRDVFPQLEEVNKRFAFRGPVNDPLFECQGVYDIFHDKAMAVRIKYENVDANFGFWGIGVPPDSPFDITPYRQICFWAYAQNPGQSFRLKMKDITPRPNEDGLTIILGQANAWEQICTDLTEFSSLGIEMDKLENINLGFEKPSGSAEIWVDDFELVK